MDKKEYQELMNDRAAVYRLLGRLYRKEVDQDLLNTLKGMEFDTTSEFSQGFKDVKSAIDESKDPITDFAVDYARMFLGAGIAQGTVAFPFESVYTSRDGLVMQDSYESVLKIYRQHGVSKVDKDLYEDHIGLELEFMGFLCQKATEHLEADKQEELESNLEDQKNFVKDHLLNWVPKLLSNLNQCPGTSFYKGIGQMTEAFLKTERELLLSEA